MSSYSPESQYPPAFDNAELAAILSGTNNGIEAALNIITEPDKTYSAYELDQLIASHQTLDPRWIPARHAVFPIVEADPIRIGTFVLTQKKPKRVQITELGHEIVRPLSAHLIDKVVLPHHVGLNILIGESSRNSVGAESAFTRLGLLTGMFALGQTMEAFKLTDTHEYAHVSAKTCHNHLQILNQYGFYRSVNKKGDRVELTDKAIEIMTAYFGILGPFVALDPVFIGEGNIIADELQSDPHRFSRFMQVSKEQSGRASRKSGARSVKLLLNRLSEKGKLTTMEASEVVGLRKPRTYRILCQLADEGLVQNIGDGRDNIWVQTSPVV